MSIEGFEVISLDKGALRLRAPRRTEAGITVGMSGVQGVWSCRYLTGPEDSISSGVPRSISVGDCVNVLQYDSLSSASPAVWRLVSSSASLPIGAVPGDVKGAALGRLYVLNTDSYYQFEMVGNVRYLSQFGAVSGSATEAQLKAMLATSKGRTCVLDAGPIRLSNTITLNDDYSGISIVSEDPGGEPVKLYRYGTVDTWRACFHVETSYVYFDNLWLEPEEGFSNRCGISYGASAGAGNSIGSVMGAYWDLGLVMPKLTPEPFTLDIELIEAYYGGRTYSSDVIDTPPGSIRIKSVRGFETGFLDVSGGSLEIGSVSWFRHNADGMKKGAQQIGGTIKVGTMTQTNTMGEFSLVFGTGEPFTGPDFDLEEVVTGHTSGATAKVHARHRRSIDVYDVSGTFQVAESVTSSTTNLTFVTTAVNVKDRVTTFQNNGDNFDLIQIGSISVEDHHGDILWILNWGSVIVDSIRGYNLYSTRNVIRHSPAAGGAFPGGFGRTMKIGSVDLDTVALAGNSTWFPFFFESGADFACPSFKAINISKSTDPGAIVYSNGGTLRMSNVHIQGANSFSRPININNGNNGSIIGALIDVPGTRWATFNGNNWALAQIRYTATSASDGTGTGTVLTDVVKI